MINVKHRRIVRLQDVIDFHVVKARQASFYMSEVREAYEKKPKDFITVTQYCTYHKIPEQEFIENMLRPYPKKHTTL